MMSVRIRSVGCAVLLTILSAAPGCAGKPESRLTPVSGTVTCDGRPLAEGSISFKTVLTGALDTLPIREGRFDGNVLPGERRVEIASYRSRIVGTDSMKGEVKQNLISAQFNTDSTLTATVTARGPETFAFEVKSK